MNFRDRLVKEPGDRIGSIVVYGSVAKGEAREDSDVDVLVVGTDKEFLSKLGTSVSSLCFSRYYLLSALI